MTRTDHAAAIRAARSEEIRAGIKRAIPTRVKLNALDARGLATWTQNRILRMECATFGLEKLPDVGTIRKTIAELQVDWGTMNCEPCALKPALLLRNLAHDATVSTT